MSIVLDIEHCRSWWPSLGISISFSSSYSGALIQQDFQSPCAAPEPTWKCEADDQQQSDFFRKLPIDIRVLIYEKPFLDLGRALHICRVMDPKRKTGKNMLVNTPCFIGSEGKVPQTSHEIRRTEWGTEHESCLLHFIDARAARLFPDRQRRLESRPCLPLLTICQRMYV
jgi:hypothetical protein